MYHHILPWLSKCSWKEEIPVNYHVPINHYILPVELSTALQVFRLPGIDHGTVLPW